MPHQGLVGPVTLATLSAVRDQLRAMEGGPGGRLDLRGVTELDSAGAWLLVQHQRACAARGTTADVVNATEAQALIIATVAAALPTGVAPGPDRARPGDGLAFVGAQVAAMAQATVAIFGFLGLVIARLLGTVLAPRRLRLTALVHHMGQAGLGAVPIVALMGFLIGVVLAFQGAVQLKQFGAEVFVVDLISISILRELGILLTAIIVAGRSASAFTAAIGSMKMREEVDAMRVLGLDPIEVLVLPRVLALVLTLPILGVIADLTGLIGGGTMAWLQLGISPGMFRTRVLDGTDVTQALIGLVKAPVFAMIIGVVGCFHGMQVEGNAESLGRHTSASVVLAIFLVLVADALFSIFFAVLGL